MIMVGYFMQLVASCTMGLLSGSGSCWFSTFTLAFGFCGCPYLESHLLKPFFSFVYDQRIPFISSLGEPLVGVEFLFYALLHFGGLVGVAPLLVAFPALLFFCVIVG